MGCGNSPGITDIASQDERRYSLKRLARRHAGQPPTAPLGGGFAPTRGRGLPSSLPIF